jgi:hypothetical protein
MSRILKNSTFRKLDLFPYSCERTPGLFRNTVLLSTRRWAESKNTVILGVIRHHQNP